MSDGKVVKALAVAAGLTWAAGAWAAPGSSEPGTVRGEVLSFGKNWVEIAQPNGAVIRLPRSKLSDPDMDLRPGRSASFGLSAEEVRDIRVLRTVRARKGNQPPSEWRRARPGPASSAPSATKVPEGR